MSHIRWWVILYATVKLSGHTGSIVQMSEGHIGNAAEMFVKHFGTIAELS